jgi:DNA-binding transcriptional MerR regulator
MDESLTIGRFARLSGLTIGALRHYDELDLLRPARVDPESGYRSYDPSQLTRARTILRLRGLEMPLEEIRAALNEDDLTAQRKVIKVHLRRVEARTLRLQWILHVLRQVTDAKEALVPELAISNELDPATRRQLAVDLYNHVWRLLETPDRKPEQDDEMLHAAHASRYHWGEVGDEANRARGEWQCSRVYAVLGRGEPAMWHAQRCLSLCQEHQLVDWDLAAAYEAMARAAAVAGDPAVAEWKAKAQAATTAIADVDDRAQIEQELATLP